MHYDVISISWDEEQVMDKCIMEAFNLIEKACKNYDVDFMFSPFSMELFKVTDDGFSYKKQYSYNHINLLDMSFMELIKEFVIEFERAEKLNNKFD